MKNLNLILIITGLLFATITRIILPFAKVYTNHGIILNTPDAYIMVRYADVFPRSFYWDYFSAFPIGHQCLQQDVFPYIIYVLGKITNTSNMFMASVIPVLLFFTTIYVIYHIAKTIFNKQTAVFSIFILCLLPGDILNRTSLGAGDYHCWEIFLLCLIMYIAIKICQYDDYISKLLLSVCFIAVSVVYFISWQAAIYIWLMIFVIYSMSILLIRLYANKPILSLVVIGLIAILFGIICQYISPDISTLLQSFNINTLQTITEAYPLFFTARQFELNTMMAYFGITFYITLFGIGWLFYRAVKHKQGHDILFLSWTLIIFTVTLIERRFDYYFGINAAIITAFVINRIINVIRLNEINTLRLIIVIVMIISFPIARQSIVQSTLDTGYMTENWYKTCQWLKSQNTLEHEKAYYNCAKPDYGVISWWSYGYWLMAEGHQAVLTNGATGNSNNNSEILLSTSTDKAIEQLKELNIRYIIICQDMFKSAGLQTDNPDNTFMYKVYNNKVDKAVLEYQSGDVKVFSLPHYELTEATKLYLQSRSNYTNPNKGGF